MDSMALARAAEQEVWVRSISELMSDQEGDKASSELPVGRFFKVPAPQRAANPGAYDPFVFALGPHHAKFESCASISDHFKIQAAKTVLSKQSFDAMVRSVQAQDLHLRFLYGVEHDNHIAQIKAPALAHLLVLDAVAILVATLMPSVFTKTTPVASILWKDVILLENQIPLFLFREVLQRVASADMGYFGASPSVNKEAFILDAMIKFIEWHLNAASPFRDTHLRPLNDSVGSERRSNMTQSLLSCIYDGLTGTDDSPPSGNTAMIPSASHLHRCGVRFKSCKGFFTSIDFNKETQTLSLPKILVSDDTRRVLLNLLAFESTSRFPHCCAVTSYITFMDCLIDTEADVQVLVQYGIVENHMSSHAEVAAVWNKLRLGLPTLFTENDAVVIKQVNRASRLKWRKWSVAFMETYWEQKPWLLVSIAAATILLVLAFLQTLYTMK